MAEDTALSLQRLTTDFVALQDRVRLQGELESGSVVVLWLTQRLLNRLLPVLWGWLELQAAGSAALSSVALSPPSLVELEHHYWEQHTARLLRQPQAPVHAQVGACEWLVEVVDVQRTPQWLRLLLRAPGQQPVALLLQPLALRRWLDILLQQYAEGQWPTTNWPLWMTVAAAVISVGPAALH